MLFILIKSYTNYTAHRPTKLKELKNNKDKTRKKKQNQKEKKNAEEKRRYQRIGLFGLLWAIILRNWTVTNVQWAGSNRTWDFLGLFCAGSEAHTTNMGFLLGPLLIHVAIDQTIFLGIIFFIFCTSLSRNLIQVILPKKNYFSVLFAFRNFQFIFLS